MSTSKILVAGVVAGIVGFFLGFLVYGNLLMDFFSSNGGSAQGVQRNEEEMIWWALIVGHLLWGILLAYIFGQWATISTAATGAKSGAVIGLLMSGFWNLVMYATTNLYNLTAVLADIVIGAVLTAIVGAVAAWMLGRGR